MHTRILSTLMWCQSGLNQTRLAFHGESFCVMANDQTPYKNTNPNYRIRNKIWQWKAYRSSNTWPALAVLSSLRMFSLACISLCRFDCRSRMAIFSIFCDRRFFHACQHSYSSHSCLSQRLWLGCMQTITINHPVAQTSVSLSVMHVTVVTRSADGATSMRPLLHYCNHLLQLLQY